MFRSYFANQSIKNFEVIIVDNLSKDSTIKKAKKI